MVLQWCVNRTSLFLSHITKCLECHEKWSGYFRWKFIYRSNTFQRHFGIRTSTSAVAKKPHIPLQTMDCSKCCNQLGLKLSSKWVPSVFWIRTQSPNIICIRPQQADAHESRINLWSEACSIFHSRKFAKNISWSLTKFIWLYCANESNDIIYFGLQRSNILHWKHRFHPY